MSSTTRRAFLTGLAGGTLVYGVGRASADGHLEPYETVRPEHVSIRFDRAELETYQPSLNFPSQMTRPKVIYAWTADSAEWPYTAHCYVVYYETQDTTLEATSHRHDREIVQVFTSKDANTVEEAVYSAGHWSAYRDENPATLQADDGGRHVKLRVNPDYRHYIPTDEVGNTEIDIEPLGTEETLFDGSDEDTLYERFPKAGWAGYLRVGALQVANQSRFRPHYWSEEALFEDRLVASIGQDIAAYAPAVGPFAEFGDSPGA